MSVLSDKRILEERKRGNVVVSPFNRAQLKTSSYDVTLGTYYYRMRKPEQGNTLCNIFSKEGVDAFWGTAHLEAQPAKKVLKDFKFGMKTGVREDDLVILLEPGEMILAHTQEFIGGVREHTTMMKARSSMGRWDITVCRCAGWGDVGYFNRWTMEIKNENKWWWRFLKVGMPIAQIEFFETGPILETDYSKTGKYQVSNDLAEMQRTWTPNMMLPKLYKDHCKRRR